MGEISDKIRQGIEGGDGTIDEHKQRLAVAIETEV
jgi:hypothetical protein